MDITSGNNEKVTVVQAVQKLSDANNTNNTRLADIEKKLEEIYANRNEEMGTPRLEESKQHWESITKDVRDLKLGLQKISQFITKFQDRGEDEEQGRESRATTPLDENNQNKRQPTTNPTNLNDINMYNTASSITRIPPTTHTIVIPPTSAIPTFSGNSTENPRQFLIRVQEYTETVNHWDNQSLLSGISQFLRGAALEWYCQLRISHRRPQTWIEFTNLFLNQFNSPVRRARQEQLWKECRQEENETINEFLVRLQALWQEQKPNENEDDLVRHLMCKMKNSLLSMIGVSRCESLDEIIMEAQKVEEILYQRSKQHRNTNKKEMIEDVITTENYNYNDPYEIQEMSAYQSRKQPNTYRQQNYATTYNQQSNQYKNFSPRPTGNYRYAQSRNEIKCYACGMKGHLQRNCPGQFNNYQYQQSAYYSKNDYGAQGGRDRNAPM